MSDERSPVERPPGRVITFYSYKGGVGRSMAMANIALLLARLGRKVLVIDWDLEAPGLDRYFRPHFVGQPEKPGGLLGLLESAGPEVVPLDYDAYSHGVDVRGFAGFRLLSSGDDQADYARRLAAFSWANFFEEKEGGTWLDRLRERWQLDYEFVLIDSRTGVTDSGGVCTIKLPDQLVFVLTANQQNLDGCKLVIEGIHQARLEDPSDPTRLLIFPLLSRYDGRVETDLADEWLQKCAELFAPVVADWLDKGESQPTADIQSDSQRRDASVTRTAALLRRTKLPHVPRYAFGEELSVLRDSHDDPERLPYYYSAVSQIIVANFHADAELLHGATAAAALATEEVRKSAIEQQKAAEEIALLEREKIESAKRVEELEKMHQQVFEDAARTAKKRAAFRFGMLAAVALLLASASLFFARERFRNQTEFERLTLIVEEVATEYERDKPAPGTSIDPNRLQRAIERVAAEKKLSTDSVRASLKSYAAQVEVAGDASFIAGALSKFTLAARKNETTAWMEKGNSAERESKRRAEKGDSAGAEDKLQEAETAYRRAIALFDPVTQEDDFRTTSANLATIFDNAGRYEEALPIRRSLLAQAKTPDQISDAKFFVAITLQNLKRHAEAEPLLREVLKMDKEGSSKSSLMRNAVSFDLFALGDCLLELGKLTEAEDLLRSWLIHRSTEKTAMFTRPPQAERLAKNLSKIEKSSVTKPIFQQLLFSASSAPTQNERSIAATAVLEIAYKSFLKSQGLSEVQVEQEIKSVKAKLPTIPSEFRAPAEVTKPTLTPSVSRSSEQHKTEDTRTESPSLTPPP